VSDALVRRLDARASRALGLGAWPRRTRCLAAVLLTPSIHRHTEFDAHLYRFLWRAAEARPSSTSSSSSKG
jgi:hypothetical protein